MSKRTLVLIAVVIIAVACQKGSKGSGKGFFHRSTSTAPSDLRNADIDTRIDPPVPAFMDKAAIGTKLAADGSVADQQTSFVVGEPIFVTMRFRQSPAGLQSSINVIDELHKDVHREIKQMNGAKVSTFKLPPLKPGQYKVEGFWGGNVACEFSFRVAKKR